MGTKKRRWGNEIKHSRILTQNVVRMNYQMQHKDKLMLENYQLIKIKGNSNWLFHLLVFMKEKRWSHRNHLFRLLTQNKVKMSYQMQHINDLILENERWIKSKDSFNRLFYWLIFIKERRWGDRTRFVGLLVQKKARMNYQR